MSRRAVRYNAIHAKVSTSDSEDEGDQAAPTNSNVMPFTTDFCLDPSRIIHLFKSVFATLLESDDLNDYIQQVKGFLYDRNYTAAFDSDDKRYAYVTRWTPPRALSYASLFSSLPPLRDLFRAPDRPVSALCIGGGASAEVVGLAAFFSRQKEYNPTSDSNLTITVVDVADWRSIVTEITSHVRENWLYDATKLSTEFVLGDVLSLNLSSLKLATQDLITLMFTTNELFADNRKETIRFLHLLNHSCRSGAFLLVAESAGSYSNIKIGSKQFPVQFLVDMVLVGKEGDLNAAWEIVEQSESCWYRVENRQVSYPQKLENMRYFYRLYRKR